MKPTEDTAPSYFGELLLLRLLSQSKGETPAALDKVLRPMLKDWRGPEDLRQSIQEDIAALEEAGHVGRLRKSSFAILASGKRVITAALGLKSIPANANWRSLKDRYFLMCVAQRLSASKRAPKQTRPLPEDEKAFAQCVLAAARASKTGLFGGDKVFISHVLRQLEAEGFAVGEGNAFKERLVATHRSRLLSLSRADLVQAMDPADVEASEARYLNASFHFVRI